MQNYLDATVSRARTTLSIFAATMITGFVSYLAIPIELNPDVQVPIIVTTIIHEGISPEDAERLLAKPSELELKSVNGIKEYTSFSSENAATLIAEFDVDFDSQTALAEVREAINRAKARFPANTEEPIMQEVSAAGVPVVQLAIGGQGVPERTLLRVAEKLQREIENLPGILEAIMIGNREELLEAQIDPSKLETYGIPNSVLVQTVLNNNRLIPAGQVDTGHGSFAVKVPGLIEGAEDLFNLPLASNELGVLTVADVADVRRTFKDATRYSYANGQQAIALNVNKRKGANLIEVMEQIESVVESARPSLPPLVEISYLNNTAPLVLEQNMGLQGNMATAMVLVLIVVIATVGVRSGLLVTLAVPFSFFFAFIVITLVGFTYNFMVIFGLLLGLGMLIDGAIVMVEYADRKMAEGLDSMAAYRQAVHRMFWPIMASTATTLAAFLPLMFWPGVSGQFMSYLPVTVFAVLIGSLFYALLFAPTIGALIGKSTAARTVFSKNVTADGRVKATGVVAAYESILSAAVNRPITTFAVSIVMLASIFSAYSRFGKGVEFFTSVEPAQTVVNVFARGNHSPAEVRDIMIDVQARIDQVGHYKNIITQSGAGQSLGGDQQTAPDLIGTIFIELTDRRNRDLNGFEVEDLYRDAIANLPGARGEVVSVEQGPPVGKEIQIQLSGEELAPLFAEASRIREHMENDMQGLIDIDDTAPIPGIEWEIQVDRARAAMMGASMNEIGTAIQLMTNGVFMGDYRPNDSEEEVDIRVRYPAEYRGLDQLDSIRISTTSGPIPISSFVKRVPNPAVTSIQRVNGTRVVSVRANPAEGFLADSKVGELRTWLLENPPQRGVEFVFRGANEEQEEAGEFLVTAFSLAMVLMGILLVTQFNSYYQALIILSSVVMSTSGVLLGLILTGQTFSIILTGIGIVALSGIIVNNNIVLIDTYNYLRNKHTDWTLKDVIVQTGIQRLRPVFLTTFTTGFGLLPLAMHVSVDLIGAEIESGGPITSQWVGLASAIVSGLSFATVLTLIVTPALLAVPEALRSIITNRNSNKLRSANAS
ncbi:efflux RND transporter permease subunit [Gammaproteobacteria bacterium]|nr:efflux RND transporter permease subunit [Gammaproteobacteria bacterium]